MKTKSQTPPVRVRNLFCSSALAAACLVATTLFRLDACAADITWDAGPAGTATTWLTANAWNPDVVPTNTDNAIFDGTTTNTTTTIQMTTAAGLQRVGSITLAAGNFASRTIRNNSTTTRGALELNGVDGTLLANYDDDTELILLNAFGTSQPMTVRLATNGNIHVANAGNSARIAITASIQETNGSWGFTKTGPGILYLQGTNNNFTGPVTNAAGALRFNDTGTLGTGVAPLYLTGGDIISGLDRSAASDPPIANPIVVQADTSIYNDGGNINTTRTIPLSGPWSGTAGTVKISNFTLNPPQTFQVRLSGTFSFSRPIIVGIFDTPDSLSVLQLYNSATNGPQTFSGDISGAGQVRRQGATTSAAGTTIFTGNNSYSGGTVISYGALLANNTVGSALGSGVVTVATNGVLGGNGSVVADTTVSFGGMVSPGSTTSNTANLNISALTLGEGGNYLFEMDAATGTAGVNWDLITCSSGWTDAASSGNPFTIKVSSKGLTPTGWNPAVARNWVLIQSSSATGFDPSHFALDLSSFSATVNGGFIVSVSGGSLVLSYIPGSDLVINVPAGSQTQAAAGHAIITGATNVVKVGNGELVLDNAANTYSGQTKILAGTLSLSVDALNGAGALGANSTPTLLGDTNGSSSATLNISADAVTDAHNVVVRLGSSGLKTIGTTITSGTATFSGGVSLGDSATLTAPGGGSVLFSGNFTGSGGLAFGGGGTITLSAANSYTGPSTLTGGTLNLNAKALGANTFTISGVSTLDNTSAASVTLNDSPQNWNANFTFTGTTNLNLGAGDVTMNATRTLTVNSNTLTVGGRISGNAGLVKLGAGTLALTGATTNAYTGGTTNLAGVLAVNGTTTLGDGNGPLVFSGGNLLNTGTRAGAPIANPVFITTDTTIYGNSTAAAPSTRIFPFTGSFSVSGGAMKIGNTGLSNNLFVVRLQGSNYTSVTWPIVIGDAGFDTPGAISQLDLYNENTAPVQTVSGLLSGSGAVRRSLATLNGGGTTILTAQNTYAGGTELNSGAIGFGSSSISSGGAVLSGPVGTGLFTIGAQNNEAFLTLFASGGARVVDNRVFINGATNIVFSGTNALTFTGYVNAGGVTKTFTVLNTALTTFSGQITNSAALVKAGAGNLALTGDNSSRTNTTTVADGTLLVSNTTGDGTGSGAVTVSVPGVLGGTGTVGGPIAGNGSIAPGASAGTLTAGNGVDLSGGGTYVWELAANSTNNPGVSFDVLSLTNGNLALGGLSKISINFIGAATAPDATNAFWQATRTWRVLSLSGGAANPGNTTFAFIVNGSFSAGTFATSADANGILLTFTPGQPSPPQPVISPTIAGAGTASATVSWSSTSGYTYTVQYKTNLNQVGWLNLGTATASGPTTSLVDNTGPHTQRYYRVIWP
jgi:autotransporter-associated beta strand protein